MSAHRSHALSLVLFVLTCTRAASPATAQGVPIGFSETFALAADRGKTLEQLIPGSEDFYYYSCLDRQQKGEFDAVPALLAAWIERHGRTGLVERIENRQALLEYARDPSATFTFLGNRLNLRFDDARTVAGSSPGLPTALDPASITQTAWMERALRAHPGSLDGLRETMLPAFAAGELDDDTLMLLLQQLKRPDVPNLVTLVARNLKHRRSGGFGSLAIHERLLSAQLDELARLVPSLLGDTKFVSAYVTRLAPSADVAWKTDVGERTAFLDRLWAFAERLPPAQNTFKAHVLYNRLAHDLANGTLDRERFITYLKLPRPFAYVQEKLREAGNGMVTPGASYPTGLAVLPGDEALVRRILAHFLENSDSTSAFDETIDEEYLRKLFATTKILAGTGDMERWYSLLGNPAEYEALKDRVDLEFAPTQRERFAANDPVAIDIDVKNVPTLLVKVFALDAYGYQRDSGKDVHEAMDLDGLVANEEQTYRYSEPPLRRVRRHFEFPALREPGSYVVEFLGNGVESRALIQKGSLRFVERLGAAGHVLTVLDDSGSVVKDAGVWFASHEYVTDARGEVNVPYGTDIGYRPIVLHKGALATLDRLYLRREDYALAAGIFVDREALVAEGRAEILVRPSLTVNSVPISNSLLEEAELVISAVDQDGIASEQTVRDLKLTRDAEIVHTIAVPPGLATLSVRLRGRVENLSKREAQPLASASASFDVNVIDHTVQLSCPLLGQSADGYFIDLLGKNGEALAGRALTLRFSHRDFNDPFDVALQTDAVGRVRLGALSGIEVVEVLNLPEKIGVWRLRDRFATVPETIHGVLGTVLRVPFERPMAAATRGSLALFELRGGRAARDLFDHLALVDGHVELRGLAPGNYQLWLPGQLTPVSVSVTAGPVRDGWVFGRDRWLELTERAPVQIGALAAEGDDVRIQVGNASSECRVHVWATRYLEPFEPWQRLSIGTTTEPDTVSVDREPSRYAIGREIGDEYRYILGRREAVKFPGNMLKRPSLLLNPWSPEESTAFSRGRLGGRGGIGRAGGPTAGGGSGGGKKSLDDARMPAGTFPNLDFLPASAAILVNLRPDANGVVRVRRADLGSAQLVHVVAVDGDALAYRSLALAEKPREVRDRRLVTALGSTLHFTEQRSIEFVDGGGTVVIDDANTARTETLGSLADVYRLFQTLSGNADLDTFGFLLRWPKLSDDEKRELYGKHACHELHFFLHQKDPQFFATVVRPFLANKLDKTFLDEWLLDVDLTRYLDPWAFGRLNLVERILLLQRQPGERTNAGRIVREALELVPPDPAREGRVFSTALSSGALEEKLVRTYRGPGDAKPAREPSKDQELGEKKDAAKAPAPESTAAAPALQAMDEPSGPSTGGPDAGVVMGKLKESSDLERRKNLRELYRPADRTRQYIEHDYWHRVISEAGPDIIPVNAFWRDLAEAAPGAPFHSKHFAEATSSLTEMLFALAVLDLPFSAEDPPSTRDGARLTLRPATPVLLVRQEIRPATPSTTESPVLIGQNDYRLDDRYRFENGERRDHYVSGEYLVGVAYGCQVVLTNPTSTPRTLDVLLQIPSGAIGIGKGFVTRGRAVQLGAFATISIEYSFYFPEVGAFSHFPAHVASGGALVCAASPSTMKVVATPTVLDTTSWEHVSQDGSADDVLLYLDAANLLRTDLSRIAWRMRDRKFFDRALALLRARHVYDDRLWSYSVLHADEKSAREYLRHADSFAAASGNALASPLLAIDAVERHAWQHVEFEPLFAARAQRLEKQRTIQNRELAEQYEALLAILCCKSPLGDSDWLSATYYLMLQDRVEEALAAFAHVRADALPTRMQYDYLASYLDFFTEKHAQARGIAEKYRDHPVPHWRARFRDVLAQLDEAEGKAPAPGDARDRTQRQTELAATEPALDLDVDGGRVTLRHANLPTCEVRYFRLDVEFAFSTTPFTEHDASSTLYVQPARRDEMRLDPGQPSTSFDLPTEFKSQNLLVEVRGGGIIRRKTAFASALAVQTVESYGQLKVTNAATSRPEPKVYVKVYARLPGGQTRFHKDGYTDLRGRFDYASVSEPGTENAERFAILVLSEHDGAVIREVAPPGK